MFSIFQNPLLRFIMRMWWLPVLTLIIGGFFLRGGAGLGMVLLIAQILTWVFIGLIAAAYLHALVNAIRGVSNRSNSQFRFLCPTCLRFGGFKYACGSCEQRISLFIVNTDGAYVIKCPHCRAALFSESKKNIAAHCEDCFSTCDPIIHHHRRVWVLGALTASDFAKLGEKAGGVEKRSEGGLRYLMADDGNRLTYVLCLEDLTGNEMNDSRSALAAMDAVWVDAETMNALQLGEAVDRFFVRAHLSQSHKERLTVCVPPSGLEVTREHLLKTRFGRLYRGVSATNFIPDRRRIGGGELEPSSGIEMPESDQLRRAERVRETL